MLLSIPEVLSDSVTLSTSRVTVSVRSTSVTVRLPVAVIVVSVSDIVDESEPAPTVISGSSFNSVTVIFTVWFSALYAVSPPELAMFFISPASCVLV